MQITHQRKPTQKRCSFARRLVDLIVHCNLQNWKLIKVEKGNSLSTDFSRRLKKESVSRARIQTPPTSQSHWAIGFISRPWSSSWVNGSVRIAVAQTWHVVCSLLYSQLASGSSGESANSINAVRSASLRCVWMEQGPSSGKYIPPWFPHSAAVWLTVREKALQ